jgi:predicted TIM-barrel fold metal-dependent hydrolase
VPAEAECFGRPDTYALWDRAAELGVVVSLLCDPGHLPRVRDLAIRYPAVDIVIDHLGHPDPAGGLGAPAFRDLAALADCPRVQLKLSGQAYYAREAYPYADCRPLVRALVDRFGPRRIVWGSDFPHVLLKCGYARALKLPPRAYDFLSEADLSLIMGENARRLYW